MFPPVPRHSEKFKAVFKTRTSVERSNKRMFQDYAIEEYKSQSAVMRMPLATFAVINIHLDASIKLNPVCFIDLLQNKAA